MVYELSLLPQLSGGPGHVSHVPRVQRLPWTPTATLSKGIFSFRKAARWCKRGGPQCLRGPAVDPQHSGPFRLSALLRHL